MAALLAMRWFDPSALSGLALISLSLGVLAFFVYGLVCRGLRRRSALSKVVVGALGFQVFHFLEHGLQLGYWFFNTKQKPWLTPWAQTGVDGLAFWCQIWPGSGGAEQRGAELLHLVGNTIFWSVFWRFLCWLEKRELATVQLRVPCCFRAFIFWNTLCLQQLSSLRVQAGERQRCSVDGVEVNSLHIASGGISR